MGGKLGGAGAATSAETCMHNYIHTMQYKMRLLLHLRPNYIHSASNDIHTDGPRARAKG